MFDLAVLDVAFEKVNMLDDGFVPDPIGYFVVHATKKGLRLEHYTPEDCPTLVLTTGSAIAIDAQAEALRKAVLDRFPRIRPDHFGYLCQELGKAQAAIEWELPYMQA